MTCLGLFRQARRQGKDDPAAYLIEVFDDPLRRVNYIDKRFGFAHGSVSRQMWVDLVAYVTRLDHENPDPFPDGPPDRPARAAYAPQSGIVTRFHRSEIGGNFLDHQFESYDEV